MEEKITLEKITYKNYIKVIWGLKVKPKQKNYVAPNNSSLAEAYIALTNGGYALPFAICRNQKPIGFLMIGYDCPDEWVEEGDPEWYKGYCIWRFMIDKRYQGRGYGRKAMQLALDYVKTYPCGYSKYCWLSYEPENIEAKNLYQSFGFVEHPEYYKEGQEMPALLMLE